VVYVHHGTSVPVGILSSIPLQALLSVEAHRVGSVPFANMVDKTFTVGNGAWQTRVFVGSRI